LLSENESKFLFEQLQKVGAIPGMKREQYQEIEGFEFKVTGNNGPVLQGQNYFQVDRSVYLEVTARVFDKDVLPALEKSIVQFINESKPVVRHRAEREKFYGEVIAKINSEITAMDRLKNQVDKHEQATFLNPSDLYANAVTLLEKKAEYEIKRKEIQSIHLLKGFDSLTINAKLSLLKAGAIGFAVGFAVLCFLLFIKYFAYFFKRYETTH
jgi:hypothetical protein